MSASTGSFPTWDGQRALEERIAGLVEQRDILLRDLASLRAENARLTAEVEHGHEQVARWNRSFLAADRRAVAAEARMAEGPLADGMQPFLAEAWHEGYVAGIDACIRIERTRGTPDYSTADTPNPYRAVARGKGDAAHMARVMTVRAAGSRPASAVMSGPRQETTVADQELRAAVFSAMCSAYDDVYETVIDDVMEAVTARLAEVEAERDEAEDTAAHMVEKCGQAIARAEAAESRLAKVDALCDYAAPGSWGAKIRAAACGEGDQPAEATQDGDTHA